MSDIGSKELVALKPAVSVADLSKFGTRHWASAVGTRAGRWHSRCAQGPTDGMGAGTDATLTPCERFGFLQGGELLRSAQWLCRQRPVGHPPEFTMQFTHALHRAVARRLDAVANRVQHLRHVNG